MDFLPSFVRLGCFLDDLCLQPVNHASGTPELRRWRREQHKLGVTPLAERMANADPDAIVIIGKGIEGPLRSSTAEAGCEVVSTYVVPFPGRPDHTQEFHETLTEALLDLRRRGLIA